MPGSHVSCLCVRETLFHIPGDIQDPPICWLYTNKISHSLYSSGRTFPVPASLSLTLDASVEPVPNTTKSQRGST